MVEVSITYLETQHTQRHTVCHQVARYIFDNDFMLVLILNRLMQGSLVSLIVL